LKLKWNLMPARITPNGPPIDRTAGRDVARGIGERLKQAIGPETPFPDHLQQLLDEMRTREAGTDNSLDKKR
jgi:hypothetical protein